MIFIINYISSIFYKKTGPWIYPIIIVFLLAIPIKQFGFPLLRFQYLYFLMGLLIGKNQGLLSDNRFIIKKIKAAFIIAFPILSCFYISGEAPLFFNLEFFQSIHGRIGKMILQCIFLFYNIILVPFAGIIFWNATIAFASKYIPERIKACFVFLGQYTLEIYAVHFLFLNLFPIPSKTVCAVVTFTACVFVPIGLSVLLKKDKHLSFIFFGRPFPFQWKEPEKAQ